MKEIKKQIEELLEKEIEAQEKINEAVVELMKDKKDDNKVLIERLENVRYCSSDKIKGLKDCLAIIDDPSYEEKLKVNGWF